MSISNSDLAQIKHSLTQRRDLVFLKASIERANLLRERGDFPLEFSSLLDDAEVYLDKTIQWMKSVHYLLHTGNLAAIHASRDAIAEYVAKNGMYWYDSVLSEGFIPVVNVLREASTILETCSQREIELFLSVGESIQSDLELLWLEKLLAQPLHEVHHHQLMGIREKLVNAQNKVK